MSGYSTARQSPSLTCMVSGCERQDVSAPMPSLLLCYAHYGELWAHLEAQEPDKQNWPGSEAVIRAWVKSKQGLKKAEPEARHGTR